MHQPKSGWADKGSRHEHGYDSKWEKTTRIRILKRDDYLCQICAKSGVWTKATDVDHITPKSRGGGDEDSNLQSLCKRCHRKKTRLERHFPMSAIKPKPPNVILVCGPPGAGKTSYCHKHATDKSIIIDLDDIIEDLRKQQPNKKGDFVKEAISERNRLIDSLHHQAYDKAFVIISLPVLSDRQKWRQLLGGELVFIYQDMYICEKRIMSDRKRNTFQKTVSLDALRKWFKKYSY